MKTHKLVIAAMICALVILVAGGLSILQILNAQ